MATTEQKATDDQIQTALIACGGVVSHTAERLGLNRTTLSDRIANNPDLVAARDEARQVVLDAAESELFKAVRAGKPWAIRFVLGRLGRGRGYGAKLEVEGGATGRVVLYLPDDGRDKPEPEEPEEDAGREATSAAGATGASSQEHS